MVLKWNKPKQVMSNEEWASGQADGAPPGTYITNMSDEDMFAWKAKKIVGVDPRVEIRKTARGVQILIVVRADGTMQFSANGKARVIFEDLRAAVEEAQNALEM